MTLSRIPPSLHSRHLTIAVGDDGISISYQPSVSLTLGSEARCRDVRYRVKIRLRRAAPVSTADDGTFLQARFNLASAGKLEKIIAEIDVVLDDYAKERLTPRMVEEILGISSAERRRWTKDGRLPKSGVGSFRGGKQSIQFYLHPPQKIARLAADRSTIAKWREEDAALSSQREH